ncbi:terminase [Borrelia sp. RT5S]|uniref:terminase n=1 Tax=Borrelia sp. RT5S TaxID=2898581 RepID=UPI001E5CDE3C|nr:terminase [Borrelia sp. RT5S]UGQ16717.1 terminase [Borrelia sp. RT5S]
MQIEDELDAVSMELGAVEPEGGNNTEAAVVVQQSNKPSRDNAAQRDSVTISQDEYKRLKDAYRKLPDMMPREEIDRRVEIERNSLTKARLQAEADAFKDSQKLSELEKKCQEYYIPSTVKDATSVKEAKLAFLEAMKRKYSVSKFKVDEAGDLDSQIDNICLVVQENTAYKQMVNTQNREVGKIINNTKAQRYKERRLAHA